MRSGSLRVLVLLAVTAPAALLAQAPPTVAIEATSALTEGPARLEVVVALGDSRDQPLLLDVTSEGEALQVVRGRFLRADGRADDEGRLRFWVPIVVRAQGSAIVRAELRTYRCKASCREVRASGRRTIAVGPAGPPQPATR